MNQHLTNLKLIAELKKQLIIKEKVCAAGVCKTDWKPVQREGFQKQA